MNHKTDMQADLKRIASELRAYNPAADEYKGEHIHKVWAREIEAALAGQSAGVPEGWKLVPVEPTVEMKIAGDNAAFWCGEKWKAMLGAAPASVSEPEQAFQARVKPWMLECFGSEIAADTVERNHRFFEEAGELVQACGMTASEAHQLVDYTWGRPVGEKSQEVGGVMVTLAALCLANGLDMHAAGEVELARISAPEMMAKIRAKQAAKPKHSPLPEARAAAPQTETALKDELASMTRMFHAACADLGLINEALGLDPEDGGADPILDAIEELKTKAGIGAEAAQRVPQAVIDALRFYANGHHYSIDDDHQQFDAVSGEPQNWLMSEKDDDCTMIEDGSIAKAALCGGVLGFEEPTQPIEGEVLLAAPSPDREQVGEAKDAGLIAYDPPNQIEVSHTIATQENAATILYALLDSFVEVAAGFPQAKVDERLAAQVRIYLPSALPCPICNGIEGCDHPVPERQRAAEFIAAIRSAISHWDEFGPECGFDEAIERLRRTLGSSSPVEVGVVEPIHAASAPTLGNDDRFTLETCMRSDINSIRSHTDREAARLLIERGWVKRGIAAPAVAPTLTEAERNAIRSASLNSDMTIEQRDCLRALLAKGE